MQLLFSIRASQLNRKYALLISLYTSWQEIITINEKDLEQTCTYTTAYGDVALMNLTEKRTIP